MSTLDGLELENPNIREQLGEWTLQRTQSGEDPSDWLAFREHAMALGAPDPGISPPDDFSGATV